MSAPAEFPIISRLLADALAPSAVDTAQVQAAQRLSREVAEATGLDAADVLDGLTYVPDNMLSLLDSPQGWSALAQFVAADLGVQSLNYRPQVH